MELFGHVLGFIAVILFFISYQIFDKKVLLVFQTVATGLLCIQYLLIGAYSGFALNIIGVIRNILYYFRSKKGSKGWALPITIATAVAITSIIFWDDWYSIFILSALVLNGICLGVCDTQNLRKSILISSPLLILYNIFAGSYSGIINESISTISAVVGIVRYNKAKKGEKNEG